MMTFGPLYPEVLAQAACAIRDVLIKLGLAEEQAEVAARESAEALRLTFGGLVLYVPKGASLEASQRDLEIWREFRGNNVEQLAKKFKLSTRSIHYIVKRMREVERARRRSKGAAHDPSRR